MKMLKYTGALAAIMLCAYALYAYTPEQAAARMREANTASTNGDVEKVRQIQEGFKRENSKKPGTYTKQINALQNIINNLVSGAATGGSSRQPQQLPPQPQLRTLTTNENQEIENIIAAQDYTGVNDVDGTKANIKNLITTWLDNNLTAGVNDAFRANEQQIQSIITNANQPTGLTGGEIDEEIIVIGNMAQKQLKEQAEQDYLNNQSNRQALNQKIVAVIEKINPANMIALQAERGGLVTIYAQMVRDAVAAATGGKGPQAGAKVTITKEIRDNIANQAEGVTNITEIMTQFNDAAKTLASTPDDSTAKLNLVAYAAQAFDNGASQDQKNTILAALRSNNIQQTIPNPDTKAGGTIKVALPDTIDATDLWAIFITLE